MTNKKEDVLEAVMYFPARPKQIFINPNEDEDFTDVRYSFLSGRERNVKTKLDVIQDLDFKIGHQALFSANQLQTGEIVVVRVHPADSLISVERRRRSYE